MRVRARVSSRPLRSLRLLTVALRAYQRASRLNSTVYRNRSHSSLQRCSSMKNGERSRVARYETSRRKSSRNCEFRAHKQMQKAARASQHFAGWPIDQRQRVYVYSSRTSHVTRLRAALVRCVCALDARFAPAKPRASGAASIETRLLCARRKVRAAVYSPQSSLSSSPPPPPPLLTLLLPLLLLLLRCIAEPSARARTSLGARKAARLFSS